MDINYESVLNKTGWGMYYKFLISLCCICQTALAFVYMSMFVILPFSMCNMKSSPSAVMNMIALFTLGSAVGGYINCSVFDWFGRKSPVTLFLVLSFSGCFSAAFSTGPTMLSICSFFIGYSYLSGKIAVKIYVMENMPMIRRGKITVLLDIFWTIGCAISFAASLFYVPSLAIHSADLRIASWRMFFALSGVLCVISSCITALTFSSPRYLLMKRNFVEAKETLRHIYAINCSQHADNWPVQPEIDISNLIQPQSFDDDRMPATCHEGLLRVLQRIRILTVALNKKEYRCRTFLFLWLKLALFPCTFTVCIMLSSMILNLESTKHLNFHILISPKYMLLNEDILFVSRPPNGSTFCLFNVNFTLFYLTLLLLSSAFLGQLLLYYIIDRCGRRKLLRISFFICILSCFVQIFPMYVVIRILVSILLTFFYGIAETILNLLLVELYPTRLRGTACGYVNFFSLFLLAACFAYLYAPCLIIFAVYTGVLTVGFILSTFVTDTSLKPMTE